MLDIGSEHGKQRQFEVHETYEQVPVLQPSDIQPQSGFNDETYEQRDKAKEYFLKSVAKAIQEPDWLAYATDSETYTTREELNLPRPQAITSEDWNYLRSIPEDELSQLAEDIERSNVPLHPRAIADIVVRAFELMGNDYPNLSFFRGGEYDQETGFTGQDFTIADLDDVLLHHAKASSAAGKRTDPVIVSVTFKDLVKAYTKNEVQAIPEKIEWWEGNDLQIIPNVRNPRPFDRRSISTVRRLPSSQHEIDAALNAYRTSAIVLE